MNAAAIETRTEHRTVLRVETACEFSAVRAGVSQISAWLGELALPEADLGAWELSLIEAGNNAVKYAPPEARRRPVSFEISAGIRDVEARVTDHTPGFDWPEKIALPEPDAEHGRGLYLIKSLTDEVFYLRHPGQNVLVLRRARPARSQGLPETSDLQHRLAEAEAALTDMTAELSANYESLVAVFRYSSELGGYADLAEFSNRLLRDLLQIAEADGVVLRLVSADGKKLETSLVLPHERAAKIPPLVLVDETIKSVELRAARSRTDVWFSPEEPLDKGDPLRTTLPLGNGICHGFCVRDQLVGTVAMGRLAANKPFTAAQVNLLHTFVDFLAIQIVNARLLNERTAARVTRRELEIAADIQRSLLPAQVPVCPPFSLAATCQSALQIGGDFYDVIPAGNRAALLVIADVMGKGVPAALFATVLRSTIRSMGHLFTQPGELLGAVNKTLFPDLSRVDMFITAKVAYLDPQRGGMISANAGHCPMIFWGTGLEKSVPTPVGFPLGIAVLMYTDGLNEGRNAVGEQFGEARLRQSVGEAVARSRDAEGAKNLLLHRLEDFRGAAPLTDDQTFILIRHLT